MADDDIDVARFRRRLLDMRAEIQALSETAHEAAKAVELDQTKVGRLSRMDALQAQSMAQETERRRLLDLKRIGAALERIEEGEYGYCAVCGDPIGAGRLNADPAAATCVGHAK